MTVTQPLTKDTNFSIDSTSNTSDIKTTTKLTEVIVTKTKMQKLIYYAHRIIHGDMKQVILEIKKNPPKLDFIKCPLVLAGGYGDQFHLFSTVFYNMLLILKNGVEEEDFLKGLEQNVICVDVNGSSSIEQAGEAAIKVCLNFIEGKQCNKQDKQCYSFFGIGHSAGGLLLREMDKNTKISFKKIVSISSPHYGIKGLSHIAYLCLGPLGKIFPKWGQMCVGSNYIKDINKEFLNDDKASPVVSITAPNGDWVVSKPSTVLPVSNNLTQVTSSSESNLYISKGSKLNISNSNQNERRQRLVEVKTSSKSCFSLQDSHYTFPGNGGVAFTVVYSLAGRLEDLKNKNFITLQSDEQMRGLQESMNNYSRAVEKNTQALYFLAFCVLVLAAVLYYKK